MNELSINTPAKINIGLNVIRKRTDGYHDIQTFFYPINLFDTLTISEASQFEFICNGQNLNYEDNLVVKAKSLLEKELSLNIKLKIILEKRLPVGAGLGGGSSDAAAALKGIIKFLDISIDDLTLKKIATTCGADVPYFLNPVPCYAEGIGDIITTLDCRIHYPILVVYPGFQISTKSAYENVIPLEPEYSLKKLIEDCEIDFLFMENKIKNDLEKFAFKQYPILAEIKKEFYKLGAMFALMSGSGSSVFGIFKNLYKAEEALEHFNKNYFTFLHNETT